MDKHHSDIGNITISRTSSRTFDFFYDSHDTRKKWLYFNSYNIGIAAFLACDEDPVRVDCDDMPLLVQSMLKRIFYSGIGKLTLRATGDRTIIVQNRGQKAPPAEFPQTWDEMEMFSVRKQALIDWIHQSGIHNEFFPKKKRERRIPIGDQRTEILGKLINRPGFSKHGLNIVDIVEMCHAEAPHLFVSREQYEMSPYTMDKWWKKQKLLRLR